jgi:polyvinyl alcohol dehydrogenase (cytochrome)
MTGVGSTCRSRAFVVVASLVLALISYPRDASARGNPKPVAPVSGPSATGGAGWPRPGHDLGSQRSASPRSALDRDDITHAHLLWQVGDLGGVTGTPAVEDGMVYVAAQNGQVLALDARTGRETWKAEVGGFISGSPTVTADAVYVATDRSTVRLDPTTGAVTWSVVVNEDPETQLFAGPIVVDNLVIQPVSANPFAPAQRDYTFRGNVVALDAATGQEVWRVYVSQNDATSGAGVSVWASASADPARKHIYVGTGNSYEEPTAPLADSIVAIDYTTGKIAWSQQFTHRDVYNIPNANGATGPDADVGSTPTLWSSKTLDLVGAGDKAGTFHALNRDTGKIVWERKLTPGGGSGGVIGGSAYAAGRIYVASNVEAAEPAPTVSTMFALNAATGKVLWRSNMQMLVTGPATVAGRVVLQGTAKGSMNAFDTRNGALIRDFDPPAPVGGGPSVANHVVYWGYGFAYGTPSPDSVGGIIAFGR